MKQLANNHALFAVSFQNENALLIHKTDLILEMIQLCFITWILSECAAVLYSFFNFSRNIFYTKTTAI